MRRTHFMYACIKFSGKALTTDFGSSDLLCRSKSVGNAPMHRIPAISKAFMPSWQTKGGILFQRFEEIIGCSLQGKPGLNVCTFIRRLHGGRESDTVSLTGIIEQPLQVRQNNDGRTVAETLLNVQNISVNVIFQDASCRTAAKFLKQCDKVRIHGIIKFVPEKDEQANALFKVFVKNWSFVKSESFEPVASSEQHLYSRDLQHTSGSRGFCKELDSQTTYSLERVASRKIGFSAGDLQRTSVKTGS